MKTKSRLSLSGKTIAFCLGIISKSLLSQKTTIWQRYVEAANSFRKLKKSRAFECIWGYVISYNLSLMWFQMNYVIDTWIIFRSYRYIIQMHMKNTCMMLDQNWKMKRMRLKLSHLHIMNEFCLKTISNSLSWKWPKSQLSASYVKVYLKTVDIFGQIYGVIWE